MAPIKRNLRPRHHPPNGLRTRTLDPVVLGLDVGTTATRASLAGMDCGVNNPPEIVIRPKEHSHRERFDAGDFPSAANFFAVDQPPQLCIGYIGDNPDQTPVKMFSYMARIKVMRERGSMADKTLETEYRKKIPQLERFYLRFDGLDENMQRRVMSHARKVFLAHLRHLRFESEALAASRGWEIKKVAATIPPNWDRWTQQLYILLLKLTWDSLDAEAITLLHESEAIGHWLLCLDKKTQEERPKRLILADFGGHTLSHNVFEIHYRNSDIDQFFFFTLSFDNCIHGGSELHASFVTEKIHQEIIQDKIDVKPHNRQYLYGSLMGNYRLDHRSILNGCSFSIRGWTCREPGKVSKSVEVQFNTTEARKFYDKCFAKPLAELYSVFRKNTGFAENAVVVLNGGTFSNGHIFRQTTREIKKARLRHLPWTDGISVDGRRSSNVAVGAALALVRTISVKDFMKQAVFAIMVNDTTQKDIPVIWNSFGSQKARIALSGRQGADVLIACCPLPPNDGSLTVPLESTFEFQSLSKKLKGNYTISLDYTERDVHKNLPDRLILTVTSDTGGKPADTDTVVWPVYYDPGACVIFVDIDEYDTIPSAEDDGPWLAPKRFTNKKGNRSYSRWEQDRCDRSIVFWEGQRYPSLPLDTLRQFEMDEPTQNENTSPIEILDVDAGPEPSPSLLTNGHENLTGEAQLHLTGISDSSHQRNRKRATRAVGGPRRGKRRGITPRTWTNADTDSNLQIATDFDAEGEDTDCSSAPPVNTDPGRFETQRGQNISNNTQPSQEPESVASWSRSEPDSAYSRLASSQGLTQSHIGPHGMAPPGSRQNMSSKGMGTQNHVPSLHDRPNSSGGVSERDSPQLNSISVQDSERPGQSHSEISREQADLGNVRLSVSTRPNVSPWAERLYRQFSSKAPYAQMN